MAKTSLQEIYTELKQIQNQIKDLEKEKTRLKGELENRIPAGESKAGIKHRVSIGKTVSWSKVYQDLRENLIPKTKQLEAEKIKETHTKETERHYIEEE